MIISFVCLAYGKMMKVTALFYLHDVLYDMTICSILKGTLIELNTGSFICGG
jgi:hypothetical protein